jgi:hypothetical protein
MSLQCVHVKFSGLEVSILKHVRRNGYNGEECVNVSDGKCLLSAMEYCKCTRQWYRNKSMDVCGASQYNTLLTYRLRLLCLKLMTQTNTARKIGRYQV